MRGRAIIIIPSLCLTIKMMEYSSVFYLDIILRHSRGAGGSVDLYFGILKLLFVQLSVPMRKARVSAGSRSDLETTSRRPPNTGPVLATADPFFPGCRSGSHPTLICSLKRTSR